MNRRLFVALDPPEAVRRRVVGAVEALRRAAGRASEEVRWGSPETLHVTLQFLGAVQEERIGELDAAVRAAAATSRPLQLELRGAGGFPNARRPRVVWLGLGGDLELLAALALELGEEYGRQQAAGALFDGGGSYSGHLNCFPGEGARSARTSRSAARATPRAPRGSVEPSRRRPRGRGSPGVPTNSSSSSPIWNRPARAMNRCSAHRSGVDGSRPPPGTSHRGRVRTIWAPFPASLLHG
jgi:hypothetical protein